MRFSLSVLRAGVLVLLVVGCKTPTGEEQAVKPSTPDVKTQATPSEPSPPPGEPVPQATKKVSPIRITPDGIGPLRADSNPDQELKELFPQYEIVTDSFQAEGNTYTIYRLLDEGKPVLLVEPWEGRVSEVMILDPTIQGPHGVHVGATLEELGSEVRSKLRACYFAAEGQERIFCDLDDAIRLQLTFSTEGMTVQSERPIELEQLEGRAIQGLRWLPQR